ncbi:MAG: hypothetical protein V4487_04835 [Chlamydiota bacterium]
MKKFAVLFKIIFLFSSFQVHSQCCCQDCICPPRTQGPQGPIGPQGTSGPQGTVGMQGVQGIPGSIGPQGLQGQPGPIGAQGPCCPLNGTFANTYSLLDQTVPPGGVIIMEGKNASTISIDVSTTATNGEIVFNKAGVYEITWNVEGQITPPFPLPVPSWSVGLTLNNLLVPGSVFGGFTFSPDEISRTTGNTVIIAIDDGDVLRLVNTSTNAIDLVAIANGSAVLDTSASVNIVMLTAF